MSEQGSDCGESKEKRLGGTNGDCWEGMEHFTHLLRSETGMEVLGLTSGRHAEAAANTLGEDVPTGGKVLALVGNAGPAMWECFAEEMADALSASEKLPNPMDRWTKAKLTALSERLRVPVFFPFGGPPWHPFIGWAMASDRLHQSPLGLSIHPTFGLWHAYRGAFLVPSENPEERPAQEKKAAAPCESCVDQPCLNACPVEAFKPTGYDYAACKDYVRAEGTACGTNGCAARKACPIGREFLYTAPQIRFHMGAFARP